MPFNQPESEPDVGAPVVRAALATDELFEAEQPVVSSGDVQTSSLIALIVYVAAGVNVNVYEVLAEATELPSVVDRAVS